MKAMFFLITLPESWDTFRIAISNSIHAGALTSANVESSLLTEEVNPKNNSRRSNSSSAMVVRGRSWDRLKPINGKSRSKSHIGNKKDVECFYCKKKGHFKKDCYKWKHEHGDGKKKEKDDKKDTRKSRVKIKELNAIEGECSSHEDHMYLASDVLLTSSHDDGFLLTHEVSMPMDWIIDNGALFHITPH